MVRVDLDCPQVDGNKDDDNDDDGSGDTVEVVVMGGDLTAESSAAD